MHCVKGTHRTGCLVACLRKCQATSPLPLPPHLSPSSHILSPCPQFTSVQGWSLSSIFDEYRRFVDGNVRLLDLQFIDLFSPDPSRHLEYHLKVM